MPRRDFELPGPGLGWARATSDGGRVVEVVFVPAPTQPIREPCAALDAAEEAARGERDPSDVPLALPDAGTFAGRVSRELLRVPRGATITYAELAARAGSPQAARAVGQAMARNRLVLLVPCHRVLPTGGGLGGFSGGLERKIALLRWEGAALDDPPRLFAQPRR